MDIEPSALYPATLNDYGFLLMNRSAYQVRRATVDDLPSLHVLWGGMDFNGAEMERRLTDFQLAESADGNLLGAVALEITGRDGKLHAEAFNDFGLSEQLRGMLWERLLSLARSRGLARLWTAETAPFWRQNGFEPAGAVALKDLPPVWANSDSDWQHLQLRDEAAIKRAVEIEFKRLKQEEERRAAGKLNPVSTIRYVAIFLAVLVAIAGAAFCLYLLRFYPRLLHR